jgi:hypothetical protein
MGEEYLLIPTRRAKILLEEFSGVDSGFRCDVKNCGGSPPLHKILLD